MEEESKARASKGVMEESGVKVGRGAGKEMKDGERRRLSPSRIEHSTQSESADP